MVVADAAIVRAQANVEEIATAVMRITHLYRRIVRKLQPIESNMTVTSQRADLDARSVLDREIDAPVGYC